MLFTDRPAELTDEQWINWRAAALSALEDLKKQVAAQGERKFKEEIYKRAMPFLLKLTNKKCAYCESLIVNQPPELEHYRPKSRVRTEAGVDAEADHPGYWWLAYEWSNLLPACIDCNRARKHGADRVNAGKGDQFPIKGTRARNPGDALDQEIPLLLDPFNPACTWEEHFEFDEAAGTIRPKTEFAAATIRLLGLNVREDLVTSRAREIDYAKKALEKVLGEIVNERAPAARDIAEVNDAWEGKQAFGSIKRLVLRGRVERLAARGIAVTLPVAIR